MTIKELSKRERAALLAVKEEIARRYPLRSMKLFGSKARGDADAESDLDVAIVIAEDCLAAALAFNSLGAS